MRSVDIALIKKRSIKGIFALTYRTFLIQILGLLSNLILTIYLSPAVFGVYFVVSAAIAFLSYFSDVGLAAALIQKKENITEEDYKTTFTIQQALVLTIVILAFLASGFVKSFYKLDSSGIFLFQALIISFFLSSLKTIPSIILERDLRFEKLVIPQIVETVVFNITAVFLAINGYGIASFSFAVLLRGLSGLVAIYLISPWKIGIGFSRNSAKHLLSFGIPFQANSFLALIKDDLLIAYLGKVLPLAQVGYIGFAQKWAFMPLRLIMDNVIRITFPSFSRLQENKDILGKAIEKSIFAAVLIIFPSLMGLVILSPYFVALIPKYTKWEPAIISLSFFALNASLSSISTPLTNALNAIGKIKITLFLMIFWTLSTWIITPFFIKIFGFNGVSIASALIALSVILVIYISKRFVKFEILRIIINPIISTFFMGIIIYFLSPLIIKNIFMLLFMIILGAMIYFSTMLILAKKQILADINFIRENLRG